MRLGRNRDQRFDRLMTSRAAVRVAGDPQTDAAPKFRLTWLVLLPAGLAIVTGLILAVAILAGDELSRAGNTSDASLRQIVIGNDAVNVPANMVRFGSQRRATTAARLDLYAHWPSMSGYSEALGESFNSATIDPAIVFLTLEPRAMSQEMSGRIDAIYRKYFESAPVDAGNGLMSAPLSQEGGFVDEELVFEASSPYPFAARCVRASSPSAAAYCIRDIQAGKGLTATYRFDRSLLPQWLQLETAIRDRLKAMIAQ